MKRLQVVAAIIEEENGERVLIAERPPGKSSAGLWEFPGGKIESGESPEAALKRELREELNLEVEIVRFLGEFPHQYDWGWIDLKVFVTKAKNTPQATADVRHFSWVPKREVENYPLLAADRKPWSRYLESGPTTE